MTRTATGNAILIRLAELQSIKLQQKRGPDLDEWGKPDWVGKETRNE